MGTDVNNGVKRVLFLGGESSGKTTLSRVCAGYFTTMFVYEYGRQYGEENDQNYTKESLYHIASRQREIENLCASISGSGYLFCDTNELVTSFYAREWFNDPTIEIPDLRMYHRIYVLQNDFPFVQDGSRQGIEFSMKQYMYYVSYLDHEGIDYIELSGTIGQRLDSVIATI